MIYIAVVPNGEWVQYDSAAMRGQPACHAVDVKQTDRTLCGKNPDRWDYLGLKPEDVNCKVCLRVIANDKTN